MIARTASACSDCKARLPEFKGDRQAAYVRMLAGLPDGPDVSNARQVSGLIGRIGMPNVIRPAARPGLAFVGDAALASDPLFGVGCGLAFQSAEWLADEAAAALTNEQALDAALTLQQTDFGAAHNLWSAGRPVSR